jgi:phage shock protein A
MDYDAPSLEKVEQKIEARKAEAMAKAEIHEATPAGAEVELREAINTVQADAKLQELRSELGLGAAPSAPAAQPAPPAADPSTGTS